MINITGINLIAFVKEVYRLSSPQGLGILHFEKGELSDEDAKDYLYGDNDSIALNMDYVHGRACKMVVYRNKSKDNALEINDKWYDHTDEQFRELLKYFGRESLILTNKHNVACNCIDCCKDRIKGETMNKLGEYVINHTIRGACTCGKCCDAPEKPETKQPEGHTVNLTFFKVSAKGGDKEEFLSLVQQEYPQWLDGKEHSYIEIGGDMGDQGIALLTIGLGHLLGVWKALSPDTTLPQLPEDLKQQMAGMGMISLQKRKDI